MAEPLGRELDFSVVWPLFDDVVDNDVDVNFYDAAYYDDEDVYTPLPPPVD